MEFFENIFNFIKENIYLSIIIGIFIVVFILLIVLVIKILVKIIKDDKSIEYIKIPKSYFLLDFKKEKVTYFLKNNLQENKTISIASFYKMFRTKDRILLINWLSSLLDNKTEILAKRIEINCPDYGGRRWCILTAKKIDIEFNRISLQVEILSSPRYMQLLGNNPNFALQSEDNVGRLIVKNKCRGYTICLNLLSLKNDNNDGKVSYEISGKIHDLITPLIYKNGYLFIKNTNQILIYLPYEKENSINTFLINFQKVINQYMEISSFASDIDYSIGVVENVKFKDNPVRCAKYSVVASEFGVENKIRIKFYDSNMSFSASKESEFKDEVNEIIKNEKIIISYLPIVSLDKADIFGYVNYVNINKSLFENLNQVKEYTFINGGYKEFLSFITKKVFSNYSSVSRAKKKEIFFQIRYSDLQMIPSVFSKCEYTDGFKIVLSLEEDDMIEQVDSVNVIINKINDLKTKGYSFCLSISENSLTLNQEIIKIFDYYDLDNSRFIFDDTHYFSKVSYTIERLLAYKHTIIASNVNSFGSVQLLKNLGLNYIAGGALMKKSLTPDSMPQQVSKKIKSLSKEVV